MTGSNKEIPFQKPNDRRTTNKKFNKTATPTRRPKPKTTRTGIEYVTTDSIKNSFKR